VKTVVLVAPHFVPSFLPSVHRSRLWSYYLPEFGWKPIILTTDERYYECQIAPEMLDLLPNDLEIIRVAAIPTKPVRIVGDISVRSFPFYIAALNRLAKERRFDFLHITIPANYAAVLGPIVFRRHRIPYGIDYIDPWVQDSRNDLQVFSKAWFSHTLAKILEPYAVRHARLITGINTAYFESVLARNPHLRSTATVAGMPYGGSERDYDALKKRPRETFLFDPQDGLCHVIYAGALLPKAVDVLNRLFAAVVRLRARDPALANRLRIHFVGTGLYESDSRQGQLVEPLIRKHNLNDCVSEFPSRIPYLDVLNHLRQSDAILIIGSTEPFYSPSKTYQSILSRRPVFALLHEQSTAVPVIRSSNAGEVFTFTELRLPDPENLATVLEAFLRRVSDAATNINWQAFGEAPAKQSARILATAMDEAVERHEHANS